MERTKSRASFPTNFRFHFGEFFDKRPKLLKSSPDVTTRCPNAWRRSEGAFRHPHPRQGTRLSAPASRAKLPGGLGRTPRLDPFGRRARIAEDVVWMQALATEADLVIVTAEATCWTFRPCCEQSWRK